MEELERQDPILLYHWLNWTIFTNTLFEENHETLVDKKAAERYKFKFKLKETSIPLSATDFELLCTIAKMPYGLSMGSFRNDWNYTNKKTAVKSFIESIDKNLVPNGLISLVDKPEEIYILSKMAGSGIYAAKVVVKKKSKTLETISSNQARESSDSLHLQSLSASFLL